MSRKVPGKSHRKVISLIEIMLKFPDDAVRRNVLRRPALAEQGSRARTAAPRTSSRARSTRRCPTVCREKECAKRFSAKTGTVMEGSMLGLQVWMIATFLLSTNLKSVSSMQLLRDLEITQKSAWFLAHHLSRAMDRYRRHVCRAGRSGRDLHGREAKEHVERQAQGARRHRPRRGRQGRGGRHQGPRDEACPCEGGRGDRQGHASGLRRRAHSAGGDGLHRRGVRLRRAPVPARKRQARRLGVRSRDAHTNVAESFWSMLDRAHIGTLHKMSPKHLDRYVTEFAGRQNVREFDTIDHARRDGARHGVEAADLRSELTASNGRDSRARSLAPRSGSG